MLISIFSVLGQTNSAIEYRMVRKMKYDVSKLPFVSVTIPAGSAVMSLKAIHFVPGTQTNIFLQFQIPGIYNYAKPVFMTVRDFPYSPTYFQYGNVQRGFGHTDISGIKVVPKIEKGLMVKEPITLRLFPVIPATTNYDAMGAVTINPAKPDFIYGTPID